MRNYDAPLFGYTREEIEECIKVNEADKINNSPDQEDFFELVLRGSQLLHEHHSKELEEFFAADF